MAPMTEPTAPTPIKAGQSGPDRDARREVLGALSANVGMNAQVLAQSVSKPHRDQVPAILEAFVGEGIATTDGTKYMRATDMKETAA